MTEDDLPDLPDLPPQDVVPPPAARGLQLQPGDVVTVTWPGRVIEDVDGVPIGMEMNTTYKHMTVTDSGAMVGWVTSDDDTEME